MYLSPRFFSGTAKGGGPRENQLTKIDLEIGHYNVGGGGGDSLFTSGIPDILRPIRTLLTRFACWSDFWISWSVY